jgi:hypothetical protein
MKSLFISLLFTVPLLVMAQDEYEYEITVIDSFTCFQFNQAGITGLTAANNNGTIHLSYILQDTSSMSSVMYAVKDGNIFNVETVSELPHDFLWGFSPRAVLQFDEFGSPHIYVGRVLNNGPLQKAIFEYKKNSGNWEESLISETGDIPFLAADADGSNGLGFVFWSPAINSWERNISYAFHNGLNWEFEVFTDRENTQKTQPTIVNYNNKTYVSYGEGYCADTLVTTVFIKDNDTWYKDYEDINLTPYGCGSIGGLFAKLGKSSNGVHLLTSLRTENGLPYFLKNAEQDWQPQEINYNASLTAPHWPSATLKFDSKNTAYWLNQNAVSVYLSWIEEDGNAGLIGIPHLYGDITLHDFVIVDDIAYIYYREGRSSYPFGTPVTFKEIKIELNQLMTSTKDINLNLGFNLHQNFPNPFSNTTSIGFTLEKRANVSLKIYNILGNLVKTIFEEKRQAGEYQETIWVNELENGNYTYKLTVDEESTTKQMVIINY